MGIHFDRKRKGPRRSLAIALCVLLSGTAIGIVLALGFSQLILDACQGDTGCQKPLLTLLGGIGFTQALGIVAMAALVDHLNRKSEI